MPRRPTGQYARPPPVVAQQDGASVSSVSSAPTGIVDPDRSAGVRATLTCLKGPENGRVLQLTAGSYTIGRARENEFVLKDIAASRRHLQIDIDDGVARLTDLGSGNGTKVNGKRAAAVTLRHGDTIELGSSLLVFADAGRSAPVDDEVRDDPQARVVAAADALARELHEKLRFSDGDSDGDDGHVAMTAALRTADARAGADAIARERERKPAETGTKRPRKARDRDWNETFSNVPLSDVVPGEQPLQGTAANRADPRGAKAKAGPALTLSPPVLRSMGPTGTAASEGRVQHVDEGGALEPSVSTTRQSPLVSGLLSAFAVVLIGTLVYGLSALFFDDPKTAAGAPADAAAAAIAQEKEAEFRRAVDGMQAAYAQGDWAKASAYASTALQLRPADPLAQRYLRDADEKQKAAAAATPPAPTPSAATPAAATPAAATPAAATPAAATPAASTPPAATPAASTPPPPETDAPTPAPAKIAAATPPKPKKPPSSKPSAPTSRRSMTEEETSTQFNRAVRALLSKDTNAACKILESIIERGARGSKWHEKADSLFAKKCGN